MGFLNKVATASAHQCVVPSRAGLDEGTLWQCDVCQSQWGIHKRIGDDGTYLDWLRHGPKGKPLGLFHKYRVPTKRQPEPNPHDVAREKRITAVLTGLGVPLGILDVIKLVNTSASAPYHGYQHLLTVALNSHEGAAYHDLDAETTKHLVIAALFHDFDYHVGRVVKDEVNIDSAVKGLRANIFEIDPSLTDEDVDAIEAIIRSTEYPHDGSEELARKIIQDADMMQTLEPDGVRFLKGLGEEKGRRISYADNEEFLDSLTPNTEWGSLKLHPLRSPASR